MLFGMIKYLSALTVKYKENVINATTSNKYLGVDFDPFFTLQGYFIIGTKKLLNSYIYFTDWDFSWRLKEVQEFIHHNSIVTYLVYCQFIVVKLSLSVLSLSKIEPWIPSIAAMKKQYPWMFARKGIDGELCESFNDSFTFISHGNQIWNNNRSLKIPAVRIKFTKISVFFSVAQFYNKLPSIVQQKKFGNLWKHIFLTRGRMFRHLNIPG